MSDDDDEVESWESLDKFYTGVVFDNVDPQGLGRIQFTIEGIMDDPSDWAFPVGTVGGGTAQRGWFSMPKIGAEVGIWFFNGDAERPYWTGGSWGAGEMPTFLKGIDPAQHPYMHGWEGDRFMFFFDERDANPKPPATPTPGAAGPGPYWQFIDKVSGDYLEYDAKNHAFTISASTLIYLTSKAGIIFDAPSITFTGAGKKRWVGPGTKAI